MGESSGKLTQKFHIELDIDNLVEYISEQVITAIANSSDAKGHKCFSDVELDEAYVDERLHITGSYDTWFKSYYAPATRWEPEEYELECDSIGESDDILDEIPENIRKYIKVWAVEEKDEDKDFHEDEPPDCWGNEY